MNDDSVAAAAATDRITNKFFYRPPSPSLLLIDQNHSEEEPFENRNVIVNRIFDYQSSYQSFTLSVTVDGESYPFTAN